jgi:hypothetical protein
MRTPNNVSMARRRFDVRETVTGIRIDCKVNSSQRHRSCPARVGGNSP